MIEDWDTSTSPLEGTFTEERDPALIELERQAQDEADEDAEGQDR